MSDRTRNAVVVLCLLVPVPTVGTVASMHLLPGPVGQAIYAVSKCWVYALPLVWWRFVERMPLSLSRLGAADSASRPSWAC